MSLTSVSVFYKKIFINGVGAKQETQRATYRAPEYNVPF